MYDIVIVGGGPAGTTLARLLDKSYKVMLLEKRDYLMDRDDIREKCCGGLLAPDAQKYLGKMGISLPGSIMVNPQIFMVRTLDFDNDLERYYQRFYFNMSRKWFDAYLATLIPENVDLAYGCIFKSCSMEENHIRFAFSYNGKMYSEKTKVIIGADGAFSSVRNNLFNEHKKPKQYVSIQKWFESDKIAPYFTSIFDSEITDFYSWIIPKENFILVGSALPLGKEAVAKYNKLLSKIEDKGIKLGELKKSQGSYIIRPNSKKQLLCGNDRVALVGEAAGFISPSSAEGFSYALRSSYYLAKSLNEGLEDFNKRYLKYTKKINKNIFWKRMKCPFMYNSLLRGMVMRSGLTASKPYAHTGDAGDTSQK